MTWTEVANDDSTVVNLSTFLIDRYSINTIVGFKYSIRINELSGNGESECAKLRIEKIENAQIQVIPHSSPCFSHSNFFNVESGTEDENLQYQGKRSSK
jgi:hypothetical protein